MSPDELRRVVAVNIRAAANERGVGLNALADFAGVGRTQLYDVLAGRKSATTDWLALLAAALEVRPCSLLDDASAAAKTASDS